MFRKWLIHGIARCAECEWTCEDYLTVQEKAAKHSRETGHTVNAEFGYAAEYINAKPRNRKRR